MNKAHLTAISRKKMSKPTAYLWNQGLLKGTVLDYGCGRGDDIRLFRENHNLIVAGYDPHYQPVYPEGQHYCTIICNYVLNVIESEAERESVMNNIRSLLCIGGVAYISVRNDLKALKGTTPKGTWQGHIQLDLPVVRREAGYVMYKFERNN